MKIFFSLGFIAKIDNILKKFEDRNKFHKMQIINFLRVEIINIYKKL